jgi:hypothetical protein
MIYILTDIKLMNDYFCLCNMVDELLSSKKSYSLNYLCSSAIIYAFHVMNLLNLKNKCMHGGMSILINIPKI